MLDLPIESLGLSARSRNLLRRRKFDRVGDVAVLSADELLAVYEVGPATLNEVVEALERLEEVQS
jgi:DNA-directed RNA polymerase alpha subunit